MINTAKTFGWLFILLGAAGYAATAAASLTALIPALLGVLFLAAAAAGRKDSLRRHAMHAAVVLAAVGLIGSASGLGDVLGLLAGRPVERPGAAVARAVMALLCILYLILALRSFITARRSGSAR